MIELVAITTDHEEIKKRAERVNLVKHRHTEKSGHQSETEEEEKADVHRHENDSSSA